MMAYDKEKFDAIQAMPAGELVHVMLTEYQPQPGYVGDHSSAQSNAYMWACERLNKLLPGKEPKDGAN